MVHKSQAQGRCSVAVGRMLPLIAIGALGAAWSGCERDEATQRLAPSTQNVAEHPMRYEGQALTLVGEVDEVYDSKAFELEGNRVLFDAELLVVTKSPIELATGPLRANERVMVSGTVRPFVAVEVEREIGWDLEPELEAEFQKQAALVASSVSRLDEYARWSEEEEGQTPVTVVSMAALYHAPDVKDLVGTRLELANIPVREISGGALWVGRDHFSQVLVVPASATRLPEQLSARDRVSLSGIVQEMPEVSVAQRLFGLTPGSEHEKRQLEEEAVYIQAQSIDRVETQPARPGQDGDTSSSTDKGDPS